MATPHTEYNEDDQMLIDAADSGRRNSWIRSGKCCSGYKSGFVVD